MKKPDFSREPIVLDGKKCWNVGKDSEGKEVFYHEKGYIKLKNGNLEHGKNIDKDGNFVKEGKKKNGEKA